MVLYRALPVKSQAQAPTTKVTGREGRGFGFPRRARLSRRRDFQRVLSQGRVRRGTILSVRILANEKGWRRLGLSVGRAYGPAVARNHAKRLIREAFRLNQAWLMPGIDLVVTALPGRPEKSWTLTAVSEELLCLAGSGEKTP